MTEEERAKQRRRRRWRKAFIRFLILLGLTVAFSLPIRAVNYFGLFRSSRTRLAVQLVLLGLYWLTLHRLTYEWMDNTRLPQVYILTMLGASLAVTAVDFVLMYLTSKQLINSWCFNWCFRIAYFLPLQFGIKSLNGLLPYVGAFHLLTTLLLILEAVGSLLVRYSDDD